MRTLTLGVLIVSGGTLAALPFRKYQAIPDASSAPAQVTGPTQSALDAADSSQLVTNDSAAKELSGGTSFQVIDSSVLASKNLPQWEPNAPSPAPRSPHIPLTYDDLALPIDSPPPIAQRFNATVPIRQQQLEQQRVSALVMPAMEQLAVTQQLELQRATERTGTIPGPQHDSNTAGRLASSRDASDESLPKTAPAERDRLWIRQPE